MFDMESIGRRISALRKEQNMTQMELADNLNISFQAVSNWERGSSMPDISKLPELAEILQVSIDELLGRKSRLLEKTAEGTVAKYLKDNEVSTDELKEVAPVLKPKQVDDIFAHIEPTSMAELTSLAPFVSQDVLDEMALKLAAAEDYPHIISLAPFLSSKVMAELAKLIYPEAGFDVLSSLFPFLPQETAEKLAEKEYETNGICELASIAPFVSQEFLSKLAKEVIKQEGVDAITPILPFLDQKILSDYFRKHFL